jgi:hypothetical protein
MSTGVVWVGPLYLDNGGFLSPVVEVFDSLQRSVMPGCIVVMQSLMAAW